MRKREDRLIFIGGINKGKLPLGGEEFKNQLLLEYFQERFINLVVIDTHQWRKRPYVWIALVFYPIWYRKSSILLSITSNSANRLLHIYSFLFKLKTRVVYLVIGGYLAKGIVTGDYRRESFSNLKGIVVQGKQMKLEMDRLNLQTDVKVIPNFKKKFVVSKNEVSGRMKGRIRFVFISSIIIEKGVSLIIEACRILMKEELYKERFIIDFYGPFEGIYEQEFREELLFLEKICSYKGYLNIIADPKGSYETLSDYDCLLFPTQYRNEGFPGVFLDAFICGLAIISSDWNMNSEIVKHDVNGLLVEAGSAESLAQAMRFIMDNPDKLLEYRKANQNLASYYEVNSLLDRELIPIIVDGDKI